MLVKIVTANVMLNVFYIMYKWSCLSTRKNIRIESGLKLQRYSRLALDILCQILT
jgi:hypothetical protein